MSHEEPRRPGEFELIERLVAVLRDSGPYDQPEPELGFSDDAALVEVGGHAIQTTDTMVDGVHFRAGKMPWFDVGWKSIASNQSDVAAMGGSPTSALVTLGIPKSIAPDSLDELYRGMAEALKKFGGRIVGGDIVSSPTLFITVAMSGRPSVDEADEPIVLRRDAAMAGDLVAVTGPLGGSAGGLAADMQGVQSADADELRRYHYRPEPRVPEGRQLVELGVRCAMDISDGLVADAAKLAHASGLSAVINSADVPMPEALRKCFPGEALLMALAGGEDYELVFTAPYDIMDRALSRLGRGARYIGKMVEQENEGESKVSVLDSNGEPIQLERGGWDHLIV